MRNEFIRSDIVLGKGSTDKLKDKKVIIFGIGGVGGHVAEALARCGIENFILVDNDTVSETNINRQIIATHSTIGRDKVEVMKERILDINPDAKVEAVKAFFLPEKSDDFDFKTCDYVIDAIDTVAGKIELALKAERENVKIISSMGAGNKLDPTKFEVADIYKTSVCPLAKVMRKELKDRGVKKLKVVYSAEMPVTPDKEVLEMCTKDEDISRRSIPGSLSFIPSVAGLIMASEVVKDLLSK